MYEIFHLYSLHSSHVLFPYFLFFFCVIECVRFALCTIFSIRFCLFLCSVAIKFNRIQAYGQTWGGKWTKAECKINGARGNSQTRITHFRWCTMGCERNEKRSEKKLWKRNRRCKIMPSLMKLSGCAMKQNSFMFRCFSLPLRAVLHAQSNEKKNNEHSSVEVCVPDCRECASDFNHRSLLFGSISLSLTHTFFSLDLFCLLLSLQHRTQHLTCKINT